MLRPHSVPCSPPGSLSSLRRAADQHLPPLAWPGMPLMIGCTAAHTFRRGCRGSELGTCSSSRFRAPRGSTGCRAPAPAAHALLLAAHAWAHEPLERLADLVGVAAAEKATDPESFRDLAGAWGWRSVWRMTDRIVDALPAGRG